MRPRQPLMFLVCVIVGLVVAAVLLRPAPPSVEPSSRGEEPPEAARFHAAYQAALTRKLDWNYVDVELVDVARDLEARLQLPVAVERPMFLPQSKVTFVAENLSVRTGLEFLLQPTLLSFMPHDGKLRIARFDDRGESHVARRYFVPDLRQPFVDLKGKWHVTYEPLQSTLQQHVEHVDALGTLAALDERYEHALLIRHTLEVHEHIEHLLAGLRRLKREYAADSRVVRTPVIDLSPPDPTAEVRARRGDLAFEGSLEDWGQAVQKAYGLHVHLFPPVLIDPGVGEPRVLKGDVKQARVDEMLAEFLRPHNLKYRLRPDAIVFFVPFGDPGYVQRVQAFPVWDLATSMAPDARDDELQKLAQKVREEVQADSWDWAGGPGVIGVWLKPAALIVTNTEDNLQRVAKTLDAVRRAR